MQPAGVRNPISDADTTPLCPLGPYYHVEASTYQQPEERFVANKIVERLNMRSIPAEIVSHDFRRFVIISVVGMIG